MITSPRQLYRLLPLIACVLPLIVATQWTAADERPNVLLLCIDDLRPELNCYGVDYIQSPNIDRLANQSGMFLRHYVQAPTCGASRYALLTGRYGGASNQALFQRAERLAAGDAVWPSMPQWFRQRGYRTVSVGKVSHHPGGLGGADWDDATRVEMPDAWDTHVCPSGQWQHPRGFMHGLAAGEIRGRAEEMDVLQSVAGDDDIYPDGLTTDEALRQLEALAADNAQPFFLAVGLLRPHLPLGAPAQYLQPYRTIDLPPIAHPHKPAGQTTWHSSGEFMNYHRWGRDPNQDPEFADEVRKHYAACVSYADAQVGRILEQLDAVGAKDNTIVVLWGDHGWHLGEHAIWGKHSLFEESLRAPLIIHAPQLASQTAAKINAIVETIDIFPTLCELTNMPVPDFVQGASLVGLLRGAPAAEDSAAEDSAAEDSAAEDSAAEDSAAEDSEVEAANPATASSVKAVPGAASSRTAVSYFNRARSLRTERYRLIVHGNGHRELYDHQRLAGETENVADQWPEICAELERRLDARYPAR